MNLNPAQLLAVTIEAPTIACLAGPGSGKSSTLIARIEHRAKVIDPKRIWCITFTQAGAKVMADKLREKNIVVGYVGTRHALMYRLLNKYGPEVGFRKGGVNLIDEKQAEKLRAEVVKDMGYKGSMKALEEGRDSRAVEVMKEYAHRLKRNNLVDYDSVLTYGLRLLDQHAVTEAFGVDDLLCDECQDNSELDWRIDAAIPAGSWFACGDVDQSIFAFRGAYPQGFLDFFHRAEATIMLEANYRSGAAICAAATALISHNTERLKKDVVPAVEKPGTITVNDFPDGDTEQNFIVSAVRMTKVRIPFGEIAVLCRTNFVADQMEKALTGMGIPVASASANLPPDWQHGMNVLQMFLDPRNDHVTKRVLEALAPDKVDVAKVEALKLGTWMSSVAIAQGYLPSARFSDLDGVATCLVMYRVDPEMIEVVRERIAMLPQPEPTLTDLLHDLFQRDQWAPKQEREGVYVGTLHSFKGREAECVFLPAFEEGIIPSLSKTAEIEEERRTAFMGMTRAKTELHISYAATRFAYGKTTDQQPSRFIQEAGL